jgi:hypothetical protein
MPTRPPKQQAPAQSCDCHFHIFGPFGRYPMSAGRTYTPPEALVPAYLELAGTLGLQRMVVVQASIYGTDNAVTLDAIGQFGLHRARGVAVIDDSFDHSALRRLHEQGIRGVRFNMVSGNGTPEDQLEALARPRMNLWFMRRQGAQRGGRRPRWGAGATVSCRDSVPWPCFQVVAGRPYVASGGGRQLTPVSSSLAVLPSAAARIEAALRSAGGRFGMLALSSPASLTIAIAHIC